jgi:hypothetical protein
LLIRLKADLLIVYEVVAAHTSAGRTAISIIGKAFTVKFKAFRAPAVARFATRNMGLQSGR